MSKGLDIIKPSRLLKASMLQDLEKKVNTEIDYINGVVPRLAESKRILTPYNDMVVKLVKQAEESKSVPKCEYNIKFFEELNIFTTICVTAAAEIWRLK